MGLCASSTKIRINSSNNEAEGANNAAKEVVNQNNTSSQPNVNNYVFSEMESQSLTQKKVNKAVDQILPTVRNVIMKK